jgi:hypothetical protein
MQDIFGKWMQDIPFRGRCLRVFFKPWAWPYHWFRYGFHAFGAGPFGFMFWPKRGGSQ